MDPKCESNPRTTNVPLPTVLDPIVTQSTSDFIGGELPKKSGLNPLAPEWPCGIQTASLANTNTTQGNAADPIKQNVDQLVQSLTSALNVRFIMPKTEILTFDGNPIEYWKFIHNFEVSIVGLTDDPRKKLSYLIQYCKGEAREVIENCCIL